MLLLVQVLGGKMGVGVWCGFWLLDLFCLKEWHQRLLEMGNAPI